LVLGTCNWARRCLARGFAAGAFATGPFAPGAFAHRAFRKPGPSHPGALAVRWGVAGRLLRCVQASRTGVW